MQQINPTVPSSSSSIMTPVRWGFRQWENLTAAPASNYYCSLFKIGVGIALCGLVALVYNIYQSKGKGSDGPAATPLFAEPTIESGKRPQTYEAQEIFKLIEKHKQKCIEKGASTFKEALYLLRKPGNPKSSDEIDTFVNQEPTNCILLEINCEVIRKIFKNSYYIDSHFKDLIEIDAIKGYVFDRMQNCVVKVYIPELQPPALPN